MPTEKLVTWRQIYFAEGLDAEEKLILIGIRAHTRERRSEAAERGWAKVPAGNQLSKETGISERVIRERLAALKKDRIIDHYQGRGRDPNRYKIRNSQAMRDPEKLKARIGARRERMRQSKARSRATKTFSKTGWLPPGSS